MRQPWPEPGVQGAGRTGAGDSAPGPEQESRLAVLSQVPAGEGAQLLLVALGQACTSPALRLALIITLPMSRIKAKSTAGAGARSTSYRNPLRGLHP